jgi:intracellular sulfur oxidation DsrE/DsrF family protein
MKTVVVLADSQMGRGDEVLGHKILGTCLRKLAKLDGLEAIVLYNLGVHLATKGSPVAVELRQLYEAGVSVLACGTCVEHYGIGDRLLVDRVSNMDEILATLQKAEKVIRL